MTNRRHTRVTASGLAVLSLLLLAPQTRAQDPGEVAFWNSVRNTHNPAELQAYLTAYPNGKFAVLARLRLAALGAAPPPAGPARQPAVMQPLPPATLPSQAQIVRHPGAMNGPVAALPFIRWQQFVDPYEGSFSMAAPAGWQVSGGIARRNALQYWFWLTAVSPDGNTVIAFGDASSQSFILPTPMLAAAGMGEGSLYNGGGGTVYRVHRYLPGVTYARLYAEQQLPRFCSDSQLREQRERQDVAGWVGALVHGATTAGEVRYTCRKNGMAMDAYTFAATSFLPGSPIWYPSALYGFLTPQPLTPVVEQMVAHMLRSIAANPAWVARQMHTAVDVSRIATETGHRMSDTIMQGWEERGATIDHIMEERSRATLGIDIYSDPATGQTYTVANTHDYYWRNPAGTIIGTETDTPPGPNFSRLQRVPSR